MSANITTVFQPAVTITVSDQELASLLAQNLVLTVNGGPPIIRPVLPPELQAELVRQVTNAMAADGPLATSLLASLSAGLPAQVAAQVAQLFAATNSTLLVDASTSTSTINTWLGSTSPLGVKRLLGSATITAPLVLPSGTYLDASGAKITSTFVGNMVQNTNAFSTTARDSNITIVGGTWQRNAGGPAGTAVDGSANGAHSIFLRHVDGLILRELKVGSTGGKYMIAVGDVTNFHIYDITGGSLASDTVHITGPASNGTVERVTVVTGGDDVVAITTTDYAAYSDTHGDVTDVTIRNVKGGNTTRVVLVAGASYASGQGDGHLLDRITVDTVTQTGSGAAVWTGAGGNTDQLGTITMSHIYGGTIQLRHPNHRVVIIEDAPRGINPTTQDSNTVVNIGRLILRDTTVSQGNVLLLNNAGVTIDYFELQNVTSVYDTLINMILGTIKKLVLRNPRYAGTNNMIAVGSTLGALQIDSGSIVHNTSTTHVVRMNGNGTIGTATFTDCEVSAVDTNSGILVNIASTSATVGAITVDRGTYTGIGRFLEKASGTSGATMLRLTDVTATGLNRLAQVGGGSLDFTYSNLRLASTVNQPIRIYNSASGTIGGNGWVGYGGSAAVRGTTEVIRCTAADFPVDLSILTQTAGDMATNTNASLSAGVGRALSNGTNWKNLYTGATY